MSHKHRADCAYACIQLVRDNKFRAAKHGLERLHDQQLRAVLLPVVDAEPDFRSTNAFQIALLDAADRVFSITNIRAPWYDK